MQNAIYKVTVKTKKGGLTSYFESEDKAYSYYNELCLLKTDGQSGISFIEFNCHGYKVEDSASDALQYFHIWNHT